MKTVSLVSLAEECPESSVVLAIRGGMLGCELAEDELLGLEGVDVTIDGPAAAAIESFRTCWESSM